MKFVKSNFGPIGEYKPDTFVFECTGREQSANQGYIGIVDDQEFGMSLAEGYDAGIDDGEFTAQERAELADYMIGLWTRYKNGE